jgi:hypothetical protein
VVKYISLSRAKKRHQKQHKTLFPPIADTSIYPHPTPDHRPPSPSPGHRDAVVTRQMLRFRCLRCVSVSLNAIPQGGEPTPSFRFTGARQGQGHVSGYFWRKRRVAGAFIVFTADVGKVGGLIAHHVWGGRVGIVSYYHELLLVLSVPTAVGVGGDLHSRPTHNRPSQASAFRSDDPEPISNHTDSPRL